MNKENMDRQRRIITVLVVLTIIFTFFGGSLAYFNWETATNQRTNIVFTVEQDFMCSADGGGSIESSTYTLVPTGCTDPDYAIQRTVTVNPTIYNTNNPVDMELWLEINELGTGLSNSQNFKYALTTSSTSCTEGVVEEGTFNGLSTGDTATILTNTYSATTTETYYLYIWLDAAETSTETMNQSFDLEMGGSCTNSLTTGSEPEAPVLDDGMIPVVLSADGTATTVSSTDSSWYNYDNKEWANIVLVNESATAGVSGSYSREYYRNNPGTTVLSSDILAYYVWIPRYKYRIRDNIQCSELENPTVESNPTCYSYTISDSDKELFIEYWYDYAGSWYFEGNSSTYITVKPTVYTMEEATEDVETMLATGEVYIETEETPFYFKDVILWYNEEIDPDIIYTANFNENKIVTGPRPIDIAFETKISQKANGDAVNTYYTHPAFIWDGETIPGFWVGKFEISADTSSTCYTSPNIQNCIASNLGPRILPNVSSLRYQSVMQQFETALMFNDGIFSSTGDVEFEGSYTYGLTTSTDSHMMKNSEWGAVAYLSHSSYGINKEIRLNNNSNYTTGCGALTADEEASTTCGIRYGQESSYPQSTTGNITGIFDMAGGAGEHVMGNYGNTAGSSEFTTLPDSKYYDLYSSTQFVGDYITNVSFCTLETCGGHALNETDCWYLDMDYFIDSVLPWFIRGGTNNFYEETGVFAYSSSYGEGADDSSFRSVAIVNGPKITPK